jgi:hypothetical protein
LCSIWLIILDGESGIQAIEASCAVSIRQQNFNSPSGTGKGSNIAASESARDNKRNTGIKIRLDDKPLKVAAPTLISTAPMNAGSASHDKAAPSEAVKHKGELHVGANEPNLSHNLRENVEGTVKKNPRFYYYRVNCKSKWVIFLVHYMKVGAGFSFSG